MSTSGPGEYPGAGQVESLDFAPPPDPRRRRVLVAAGLAVALVMGGGVVVQQLGDDDSPAPNPSRLTPPPTPTAASRPTAARSAADQPRTRRIEPFLAELDLDLFVRTGDGLHRIQTERRRVTTTPAASSEGGSLIFVLGSDRVLVRDWDSRPGGMSFRTADRHRSCRTPWRRSSRSWRVRRTGCG